MACFSRRRSCRCHVDRRASLTKNREGKCDPEMHKAIERQPLALRHEGQHRRDTATGLLRCLIGTVANLADVNQVDTLLHEQESHVSSDSGNTDATKCREHTDREVIWSIAVCPSSYKRYSRGATLYQTKYKIRSAKRTYASRSSILPSDQGSLGHRKARYGGPAQDTAQLFRLFGLVKIRCWPSGICSRRRDNSVCNSSADSSVRLRLQPALKRQDMSDVLYTSNSHRCSAFNVSLCNVLLVESIRMNSS